MFWWNKQDDAYEVKAHTLRTAKRVADLEMFVVRMQQEVETLREQADEKEREVTVLEDKVAKLQRESERLRRLHFSLEKAYVDTDRKVNTLDRASGGTWKTASGYIMRIRDMSTDHLKRCLAGNFPGPSARKNMEIEMKRRKEEEFWRKQPMPGETRDNFAYAKHLKKEGEDTVETEYHPGIGWLPAKTGEEKKPEKKKAYVGRIYGTPIYVPEDTGLNATVNIGNFLRRFGQ
jgi:hypothetical protein